MSIKDIRLIKGTTKDEVNKQFKSNDVSLELIDQVYEGVDEKHNWECKCGGIFERSWYNIKKLNKIKCNKCSKVKKIPNVNIKNIKLKRGMSKNEINKLLSEKEIKLEFIDSNLYKNNKTRYK